METKEERTEQLRLQLERLRKAAAIGWISAVVAAWMLRLWGPRIADLVERLQERLRNKEGQS